MYFMVLLLENSYIKSVTFVNIKEKILHMIKSEDMLHFIDQYENPVYIIQVSNNFVLYSNIAARNTYNIEGEITEFNQILQNKSVLNHSEAKKT